jgi:hypothetical protein
MSNTENLGIPYLVSAQSQPEITVNGALDDIDGAVGSLLAHTLSDANYTLNLSAVPNEALGYLAYVFTGTLTADRNIIVPTNKKMYAVWNNATAGKNLIVKTSGGTGVTIAYSSTAQYTMVYCDGTNVVQLAMSAAITDVGTVNLVSPPSTTTDPGNPGDIAVDDTYLYVYSGAGSPPMGWGRILLDFGF